MNLAWMTDIHLNFLDESGREKLYQKICDTGCGHRVYMRGSGKPF